MTINIEQIASFCKQKGFTYPSSEIYGGLAGFWDLGPLGVELMNNLKSNWWKYFVQNRDNIVGMDGSIIANPKVWKASGHVDNFGDLALSCIKCKEKYRADQFIEEKLGKNSEGLKAEDINKIIKDNSLVCPKCESKFDNLKNFNLLFHTFVGADESKSNLAYLRGETAQGMFTNFKLIADTSRQKLPFGIAQIGKCFRNEIAPRDFLFRSREFTISEIEFFIHPDEDKCKLLSTRHKNIDVNLLDAKSQAQAKINLKKTKISEMIKKRQLGEWHGYWLAEQILWFYSLNIKKLNLKVREHSKKELSHYSSATFDIDYEFSFGSKEIAGNANRGQYDLSQHMEASREKLELYDEETKKKVIASVIEPTFGMERIFLTLLVDAYHDDKKRGNVVLKLHPQLAPYKIAVFSLVNKLNKEARKVFESLKDEFHCYWDTSGSIGRRYARQDEIGTPFTVTFDFDSLKDNSVTVRDRDSTQQIRVKITDLKSTIQTLLSGAKFSNFTKID